MKARGIPVTCAVSDEAMASPGHESPQLFAVAEGFLSKCPADASSRWATTSDARVQLLEGRQHVPGLEVLPP